MPFAPFTCALGDSPAVSLPAASEVDLSPPNDLVDSNRVVVVGSGVISSFGLACGGLLGEQGEPRTVSKKIHFQPDAGQSITLHHNLPALKLLGGADRPISAEAFGEYQSDAAGNWTETRFSQGDVSPTKGGGALIDLIYYTASATITIPPGATRAWVRLWGGAGGSGNTDGAGAVSGGTGAPGYLEKFLTGLVGGTLIYTQGAAGTAGTGSGAAGNGGAGGNSVLASGTQTIATLMANGSAGSLRITANNNGLGTVGGAATGGDLNITGQSGTPGFITTGGLLQAGVAGSTAITRGSAGVTTTTGNAGRPGGMIIAWFNDAKT
jgi:hypothetical protein